MLEEKINAFLELDSGFGCCVSNGFGDGRGDGAGIASGAEDGSYFALGAGYGYANGMGSFDSCGEGSGRGRGNGNGSVDCFGNGSGYGIGLGQGISEIRGTKVYQIDNVPTIIESIVNNIAKGYIVRNSYRLVPCFVAKVGSFFAHGISSHKALRAAQEKFDVHIPLENRIADTIKKYPSLDTRISHAELFSLHHFITGSCLFGRNEFCLNHGLDPYNGEMTMRDFIELTKNSYGYDAILELKRAYVKT